MCWLSKILTGTVERPSPQDIVKERAIVADGDAAKVVIDLTQLNIPFTKLPKVWIPSIPDTNSMDGVFDSGNNNILIAGTDATNQKALVDFIKVGDIAVYRTARMYAIHRVIKIDSDKDGKYFRFKGDNNAVADPDKVRESEIQWLSIGTVY